MGPFLKNPPVVSPRHPVAMLNITKQAVLFSVDMKERTMSSPPAAKKARVL